MHLVVISKSTVQHVFIDALSPQPMLAGRAVMTTSLCSQIEIRKREEGYWCKIQTVGKVLTQYT